MQEEHLNDLVNTGLFTEARLCKLLDQDDEEGVTYVAQYFCITLDDFNLYIEQYAPIMRERGFAEFGNQFIAFRTLMEIVK
jgi:hypothetical protein